MVEPGGYRSNGRSVVDEGFSFSANHDLYVDHCDHFLERHREEEAVWKRKKNLWEGKA